MQKDFIITKILKDISKDFEERWHRAISIEELEEVIVHQNRELYRGMTEKEDVQLLEFGKFSIHDFRRKHMEFLGDEDKKSKVHEYVKEVFIQKAKINKGKKIMRQGINIQLKKKD